MRKIFLSVILTAFMTTSVVACQIVPSTYNNCVHVVLIEQEKIVGDVVNEPGSPMIPSFAHNYFTVAPPINPILSVVDFPKYPFPFHPPTGVVPIPPSGSVPIDGYIPPKIPRVSVPEGSTLANLFIGILTTVFFGGCVWVRRQTMKDF